MNSIVPNRWSPAASSPRPTSTAGAQRATLPPLEGEEREAVALRFGADMTVPEMAKVLGEPLTTVEGRVYRALRKLRAQLAED